MTENKIVVEKPKSNLLRNLLIFLVVAAAFFWSVAGINYKGIMATASGTLSSMWNGLKNPDVDYVTNMTIDGLPMRFLRP